MKAKTKISSAMKLETKAVFSIGRLVHGYAAMICTACFALQANSHE